MSTIAQAMAPKTGRPDHGHPQIEFDIDLAFSDVGATAHTQQNQESDPSADFEPDVATTSQQRRTFGR